MYNNCYLWIFILASPLSWVGFQWIPTIISIIILALVIILWRQLEVKPQCMEAQFLQDKEDSHFNYNTYTQPLSCRSHTCPEVMKCISLYLMSGGGRDWPLQRPGEIPQEAEKAKKPRDIEWIRNNYQRRNENELKNALLPWYMTTRYISHQI